MDAAPRLLSLVNQLAVSGRPVIIQFADGNSGVMGYLDRMGFFDLLHPGIRTVPERPKQSGAHIYRGTNSSLVEFLRIRPMGGDADIPSKLSNALENVCSARSDRETLGRAAFTVFAELIDNVHDHTGTENDVYAAFQVYGGKKAFVVVSDSGRGLLATLRPALSGSPLAQLSDPELIAYMLNEGVSRFGEERGLGLRQSALHALKYRAKLNIRLPTASFELVPGGSSYHAQAYGETNLPFIGGTHISFEFALDNR